MDSIILLKLISKIHTHFKNDANSKIDRIMEEIMKKKDKNKIFSNVQESLYKN